MKKIINPILLAWLNVCILYFAAATAEVYGGGYWEAIGLGNIPCKEFVNKSEDAAYKELSAVWLSGFVSGVNFSSSDVYDISSGENIYALTDLVIARCKLQTQNTLSDIATELVYKRYQDKNYTATKDAQ